VFEVPDKEVQFGGKFSTTAEDLRESEEEEMEEVY